MLDFFFAMLAAGLNSTGGDVADVAAVAPPAVIEAPAEAAEAMPEALPVLPVPQAPEAVAEAPVVPPVPQGDTLATLPAPPPETPGVVVGSGVIVGSNALSGGVSLLEGTMDSQTQTAPAVPPQAPEPTVAAVPPVPALPVLPAVPAAPAADPATNMAVVPAGLVAEPQTPTGKFTTALEVKPILNATQGNWIAVREYDGKDLLYVTHLWGWRCGLAAIAISVNDEPMQNWPMPPCHTQFATPNAILEGDGAPYLTMRLGSVQKVTIQVVYDDLSMDLASFERGNVLIP